MRKALLVSGIVFASLLVVSFALLMLGYSSAVNEYVEAPRAGEPAPAEQPAQAAEQPPEDGVSDLLIGEPGSESYLPSTENAQVSGADDQESLAGAQADYQGALQDKEGRVDLYRLLLYLVCGVLAFLALASFLFAMFFERPEAAVEAPYSLEDLDDFPGKGPEV